MEFGKFLYGQQDTRREGWWWWWGGPSCIKGLNGVGVLVERGQGRARGLGLAVLLGRPCVSANSVSLLPPSFPLPPTPFLMRSTISLIQNS